MKISQLTLKNYRGVKDMSLEFHENMNIFHGCNGSGKSTLLDSVAIMLSWFVSRLKHSGSSGRPITESDITNGTRSSSILLNCIYDFADFHWKLVKNRRGYGSPLEKSNLSSLNDFFLFLH